MKEKKAFVFTAVLFLILLSGNSCFAQESVPQKDGQTRSEGESDVEWLWGEVSSVDTQKQEITVKYLDYETDSEKEVKVGVDNKTTYENAESLSGIKVNDSVSIDYVVGSDGKYLAKNISIEKLEETPLPEEITAPVPSQTPAVQQ